MINKLTDNKFWENYWQSKKVISPVLEKNSFTNTGLITFFDCQKYLKENSVIKNIKP